MGVRGFEMHSSYKVSQSWEAAHHVVTGGNNPVLWTRKLPQE